MIMWQYYGQGEIEVLHCLRSGETNVERILERLVRRRCDPQSQNLMCAMIAGAQRLMEHYDETVIEFDYDNLHDWEEMYLRVQERIEQESEKRKK